MGEVVKPLAPYPSNPLQIDEDRAISGQLKLRRRRYIQCCGCITAFLLILTVIILVLGFTVFHVKEPRLMMNGVTSVNGTFPGINASTTLVADVSVKNPNSYSFRFSNSTTTIYYDGTAIGEGRTPAGKAKARRTLRLNVTVEIVPSRILGNPRLVSDTNDRALNISSYTRIDGKVKILNLFNKHIVVKMNCTVEYNLTAGSSHDNNCQTRVEI
ncbi:hypothetical protein L6164_019406 [Bauhinia variegata]|uniref:Uncharacterized protein n=1 Tax=Bauhinia variegata TaxID=167791 RepID=A0ACB9MT97_BAUVA|nr:hypothetical protein L6164_019406 [Bauhinia variegata]